MTLDEAFSRLTTLTTARVRLRQIQVSDATAVHAFKSDPEVTKLFGEGPHRSVEETSAWILSNLTGYERREAMTWVLTWKDQDAAIGECCLWNFSSGHRCAELGYELHPAHWHMGIMTEALRAIIAYGFMELGLHRIEADTLAINRPSENLLHRLGFKYEGTLRERHFYQDRFEDQLLFAILQEEWNALHQTPSV